jgi:hypothetical protein
MLHQPSRLLGRCVESLSAEAFRDSKPRGSVFDIFFGQPLPFLDNRAFARAFGLSKKCTRGNSSLIRFISSKKCELTK